MIAGTVLLVIAAVLLLVNPANYQPVDPAPQPLPEPTDSAPVPSQAAQTLELLAVKGRAAKTGYDREQFGNGWALDAGCNMRNRILQRDLTDVVVDSQCRVVSGTLDDPYTGQKLPFLRGLETSDDIQIDHVVALSDAWQKGAQSLSYVERVTLANDPLELLAVEGAANEQKSNGDAATWLPSNKPFRCQYVARQIAVKYKYELWVTQAEKDAMQRVLGACPQQQLPSGMTVEATPKPVLE